MKFNSLTKIFSWYYSIIITIILVLGIASSVFIYIKVSKSEQEVLIRNAGSVASVLETEDIRALTGDSSDLNNPTYISVKSRLEKIPRLDPDIRFVYLWGYRNGNPFFFVDSEPTTSPDYSPPGQIFTEATAVDLAVLLGKLPSTIKMSSDRWGTWLSALIPILDENTGKLIAVMGMDMSANRYFQTIYVSVAIPIIITIFILTLIIIGFVLRKREQEFLVFKSEMVSIASHEIRSPLTGISWMATALLDSKNKLSQEQKDSVSVIKAKSEELLSTINDLLDLAAVEKNVRQKPIREPISVREMFEKIAKNSFVNLQEKNIKLIIDISIAPTLTVSGNPEKIGRMFNNLVSNAIKYSKNEGTVQVGQTDKGKSIVFWVKDEGIGISAKDQEKIFKGFFRAERAKEVAKNGTGLGLHYVKEIVELHHGRVWCESKEGQGSTFFVELPKMR